MQFEDIQQALAILVNDVITDDNRIARTRLSEAFGSHEQLLCRLMGEGDWTDPMFIRDNFRMFLTESCGMDVRLIQGGSLEILSFFPPATWGEELARQAILENMASGNLYAMLKDVLPAIEGFEHKAFMDTHYNRCYARLRSGASSYSQGNRTCSLTQGTGGDFKIVKDKIEYDGSEPELERVIAEETPELLQIILEKLHGASDVAILRNRNGLTHGKYQNADIIGLSKIAFPEGDRLVVSALELKASNKVESIFEAISQATAYKSIANEVWIIAPGLSVDEFHSMERFTEINHLCEINGIGVISVKLGDSNSEVQELTVVRPATVNREVQSPGVINTSLRRAGWRYCQRCLRYYSAHPDAEQDGAMNIKGCGWLVQGECFRQAEERKLFS